MFQWIADKLFGPIARWRAAQGECEAHDRRISDLNQDLRRWMADRDRELQRELRGITTGASSGWKANPVPGQGPQVYSGAHIRRRAEAKRLTLHQYRDQASEKQREVREIIASESKPHAFWRRRRDQPIPRLVLTAEGKNILRRWREPATNPADPTAEPMPIDDPSRPEVEPDLAELEEK